MFVAVLVLLPLGFPVGFTVLGVAITFAAIGQLLGVFDLHLLSALPLRVFNLMDNDLLQALPLFIYMGAVMERTKLSRDLFESLGAVFGGRPGGLAVATLILGVLLAPMTGAVGATVVALGLLALPPMLNAGYDRRFACGLTAAVGTLGTVLPPSIILILLGDQMRIARSEGQRLLGQAAGAPFLLNKLFLGMVVPVLVVITGYAGILLWRALRSPGSCPARPSDVPAHRALLNIVPPIAIIAGTLYLILSGKLYTVEAAGVATVAITIWALVRRELSVGTLAEIVRLVMRVAGAMFLLIMGANTFSLVFRGFGGDQLMKQLITSSFSSAEIATPVVFAMLFIFGFFLDAIEIIFLVVPIAIPPLIVLGADPLWLAVLVGLTLQTSFLLPPSGFALFFLRNVAPTDISMTTIYRGARPFVVLHAVVLIVVLLWPTLATWLPGHV
jgi:tripartite ATP-independent transporter DctM subunit